MNPSRHSPEENWEAWLDRRLRELPDRPAPASLAPRVLAAVAARAHCPWYRRPWLEWPRAAQVVSLVAVSFMLGSLTYALLHLGELPGPETWSRRLEVWLAPLEAVWAALVTIGDGLRRLLPEVSGKVWLALGGVVALMYATCLGVGTLLYRMACAVQPGRKAHETH
jgi:hypothetical protein